MLWYWCLLLLLLLLLPVECCWAAACGRCCHLQVCGWVMMLVVLHVKNG
jgi:hypothetical protein